MLWICDESEEEPFEHHRTWKVEGKRSRGRLSRQWLDDVKEWTGMSSTEMWKEPDDCVAWR